MWDHHPIIHLTTSQVRIKHSSVQQSKGMLQFYNESQPLIWTEFSIKNHLMCDKDDQKHRCKLQLLRRSSWILRKHIEEQDPKVNDISQFYEQQYDNL